LQHISGLHPTGTPQIIAFGKIADDRAESGALDSGLETDTLIVLREAGLPLARRGYRITTPTLMAQVDFAWPDKKVCVQVHGGTIHRQDKNWNNDQRVENAIAATDWTVVKATRQLITKHKKEWLANLKKVLGLSANSPA
jgi:hypothetical protein